MRVLERNFVGARRAVEKNNWYRQFEGRNLDETCKNVWEFIKNTIPYNEDGINEQKIVMPGRAIHNAQLGIGADCKTMALMSCAILSHYAPVSFRYTSYRDNPTPTHVYCVVDGGRYIVDAVWNRYNSEKPYKYKYDKNMKISTISGIDSPKLEVDEFTYKKLASLDALRKSFRPGTEKRKLFDLLWSANVKHEIDLQKQNGINGIDELSLEVDRIFNANVGMGAVAKKPDWATNEDRNRHLLNVALPLMVASRVAFLALANFNAFGIIDRLFAEELKKPKSISRWWYRAGGNPDDLWKYLTKYRGRKAFFGVQEKVKKVLDAIKKKAGIAGIYDSSMYEFENGIGVTGVDDVAVAGGGVTAVIATITACIPVLVPLIQTIGNIFDKTIPLPDSTTQPPIIDNEPTKGLDNKFLLYGGIALGALFIVPKLIKNK
jgi:hypothetical protein